MIRTILQSFAGLSGGSVSFGSTVRDRLCLYHEYGIRRRYVFSLYEASISCLLSRYSHFLANRFQATLIALLFFFPTIPKLTVMQYSAVDLYNGIYGDIPVIDLTTVLYVILGVGIVLKFVLWVYCLRLNKTLKSDTVSKFSMFVMCGVNFVSLVHFICPYFALLHFVYDFSSLCVYFYLFISFSLSLFHSLFPPLQLLWRKITSTMC